MTVLADCSRVHNQLPGILSEYPRQFLGLVIAGTDLIVVTAKPFPRVHTSVSKKLLSVCSHRPTLCRAPAPVACFCDPPPVCEGEPQVRSKFL